jgi:hypothetical protein
MARTFSAVDWLTLPRSLRTRSTVATPTPAIRAMSWIRAFRSAADVAVSRLLAMSGSAFPCFQPGGDGRPVFSATLPMLARELKRNFHSRQDSEYAFRFPGPQIVAGDDTMAIVRSRKPIGYESIRELMRFDQFRHMRQCAAQLRSLRSARRLDRPFCPLGRNEMHDIRRPPWASFAASPPFAGIIRVTSEKIRLVPAG